MGESRVERQVLISLWQSRSRRPARPLAALQQVEGRFILSLNDVPKVRVLFAWASIRTVELSS